MKFKYWHYSILFLAFASLTFFGFSYDDYTDTPVITDKSFDLDSYWYQGVAEITSYDLDQNRYRDNHPGEIVLIQVTEDFLSDKQVKNDNYKNKNSIPVLKTNLIKKFKTGIYDYSVMSSVFTSVDKRYGLKTLKTTFSSQDWCGHSFMQSNLRNNKYEYTGHSYFENEGESRFSVKEALLEDEILNRIRINPDGLPKGDLKIIPSSEYQRFNHKKIKLLSANASLSSYKGEEFKGKNLNEYSISYPDIDRTVSIYFEDAAPYKIAGWKEERVNGFTGKNSVTTAKRKESILLDYWTKNSLNHRDLREKLKLDM
jgi:hypothetical protein